MNYKVQYNKLISTRKKLKRDKLTGIYESHHIIPVSLGGSDEKDNLVLLTPKEHWIAHCLLSKMCVGQDRYKMTQALVNMGRVISSDKRKTSNLYEYARKNISEYISEKYKGTVIVKDARTDIIIGRISKSHPKYISGEYVFYQKGTKKGSKFKDKISKAVSGVNNPRYSGITDDEILQKSYEFYLKFNNFNTNAWFRYSVDNYGFPSSYTAFRFKEYGGGIRGLKQALKQIHNLCDDDYVYKKTDEHSNKIRLACSGTKWYHNDDLKKCRQFKPDEVPDEWKIGRKKYDTKD